MQSDRPDLLTQGERARLFPVLSNSSKEGRATSIFLSCLANVREFSDVLLSSVGRKIGNNSRIRTYTEVCFAKSKVEMEGRPDGLIEVKTGGSYWYALVEAKIGNVELNASQIETYSRIAKTNRIDAIITISNQFASSPTHHPVEVKNRANLFHWSWMHILTEADLLLTNDGISDLDQRVILNELRRFLSHDSTGVKGFERMPREWTSLVRDLATGQHPTTKSPVLTEVILAWHQEIRDLGLILSRQIGVTVNTKLRRAFAKDNNQRLKNDVEVFCETERLQATLSVPEAAADVDITVDARGRSMAVGMRLNAPIDKKSSKARINWLLRQLKDVQTQDVFIRVHWPHRGFEQYELKNLLDDTEEAANAHEDTAPSAFEVLIVRQTGPRFSQQRGFIEDIEKLVPDFYNRVGSRLKAWSPPAPKIRDDRLISDDVSTEGLAEDAEQAVGRIAEENN